MGFIDGLLVDTDFVFGSLLALIDEERNRIVASGLLRQADCDHVLSTVINKLASEQFMPKDETMAKLVDLYESMKGVKLAGDTFQQQSPVPVTVDVPQTQVIVEEDDTVQARQTIEQLEKVAYRLGSGGNHKAAYELDKVISQLKEDIGE